MDAPYYNGPDDREWPSVEDREDDEDDCASVDTSEPYCGAERGNAMFQVIPTWQVDVTLSSGVRRSVWIHESHIGNVLRQVASMSFDANPLVSVDGISVSLRGSGKAVAAVDPVSRVTTG